MNLTLFLKVLLIFFLGFIGFKVYPSSAANFLIFCQLYLMYIIKENFMSPRRAIFNA